MLMMGGGDPAWLIAPMRMDAPCIAEYHALLDEEERLRADQFLQQSKRAMFISSHGALRHLLGDLSNMPARRIRFRRTEHGKPLLDHPGPAFSFSHSAGWWAAAWTWEPGISVGIDIQAKLVNPVAALSCIAPELEVEDGRTPDFHRIWCRKEAVLKAIGTGLSIPMTAVRLHGRQAGVSSFTVTTRDGPRTGSLQDIPAPDDFAAAVSAVVEWQA